MPFPFPTIFLYFIYNQHFPVIVYCFALIAKYVVSLHLLFLLHSLFLSLSNLSIIPFSLPSISSFFLLVSMYDKFSFLVPLFLYISPYIRSLPSLIHHSIFHLLHPCVNYHLLNYPGLINYLLKNICSHTSFQNIYISHTHLAPDGS